MDPLKLDDTQAVILTLNDNGSIDEDLAGYFTPDEWSAASNDTVTGTTSEWLLRELVDHFLRL